MRSEQPAARVVLEMVDEMIDSFQRMEQMLSADRAPRARSAPEG
jgi:hypothetical protein